MWILSVHGTFHTIQFHLGPWKNHSRNEVLTIIKKAIGWQEFVAIKNKSSQNIALLFDSECILCVVYLRVFSLAGVFCSSFVEDLRSCLSLY